MISIILINFGQKVFRVEELKSIETSFFLYRMIYFLHKSIFQEGISRMLRYYLKGLKCTEVFDIRAVKIVQMYDDFHDPTTKETKVLCDNSSRRIFCLAAI